MMANILFSPALSAILEGSFLEGTILWLLPR